MYFVCKWVENQAFANAVFNVKEYSILQLSQILPFIHFESMSSDFLMDFVIRNGYLFGFNTLSNIVRKKIHHDVEVTDINGRKMCGTMFDRNNIIDKIKDIKSEAWIDKNGCYWDFVKPFFYDKSKYSMKKGNAKYQLLIENGHLLVTSSS
uniref:Uncharacterized protein n=1 Tax=Panagrolaimus superbus TaxID=310955 RepID=A0A914YHY5_9BILA